MITYHRSRNTILASAVSWARLKGAVNIASSLCTHLSPSPINVQAENFSSQPGDNNQLTNTPVSGFQVLYILLPLLPVSRHLLKALALCYGMLWRETQRPETPRS